MATTPFTQTLVDNLAGSTAWRFNGTIGEVYNPRFACCSSPNSLGITDGKEPVAIIELTPNPAFVNGNVTYDGASSYDPDGSITGYAWTFESHTPATASESSSTLNYSACGVYEVTLVVTDGTGLKSYPARQELIVQNAGFNAYAGTASGVFYGSGTAGAITWTDKNAGLSGSENIVHDVRIDPATQHLSGSKTVWRSSDCGLYASNDSGCSWTNYSPASVSNNWSDSPAPSIGDLSFRQMLFAQDKLFAIAIWENTSNEWRSTVFSTSNLAVARTGSGSVLWDEIDFHVTLL